MKLQRWLLCTVVLTGIGPIGLGSSPPPATAEPATVNVAASPAKPNVVWIVLDALRPQNLSCYGYGRETSPNLDGLARDGVLFEHHYAQDFWTFPSLPSYMTGRYFPANCLDSGDWRDQTRAPAADEELMPSILGKNGYRTSLFAKKNPWFKLSSRSLTAFDEAASGAWVWLRPTLDNLLEKQDPRPFFLYVHLLDTHFPHQLAAPFDKWVDPAHVTAKLVEGCPRLPSDAPFTQQDKQVLLGLYDGGVLSGDAVVGEILDALRVNNQLDNTIVIVGADHGEALGENGRTVGHHVVCEEVMHVPLIMSGPGVPRGVRVSEMSENFDNVPTRVSLLHLATTATFDGRDLTRAWQIDGAAHEPRDFVLGKTVTQIGQRESVLRLVIRDTRNAYVYDPAAGIEFLYPVPFSIAKMENVAGAHADVAASMKKRLVERMMPKWQAFVSRPVTAPQMPFLVKVRGWEIQPQEAVAFEQAATPDAAQLPRDKWLSISEDSALRVPANAALPPICIRYEAPDGTYNVKLLVKIESSWPFSSVAFQAKAQGDADFRRIDVTRRAGLADLGEYEVKQGIFEMTLRPVSTGHPSRVGSLLFVPAGFKGTTGSPGGINEVQEELRALGYM